MALRYTALLFICLCLVLHSVLGQPEQISSDAAYYSMVMLAGMCQRQIQRLKFYHDRQLGRQAAIN